MISNAMIDHAGYAFPVEGLGPGKRVVLWVRGCSRRCRGCISPELWERSSPQPVDYLAKEIEPYLCNADGLTISGGEPFEQASSVLLLMKYLLNAHPVEVLVYTGYLLEEIEKLGKYAQQLLQSIDILIDGPFIFDSPNTMQWRGSDNQRVHLLSQRSQRYREQINNPMPNPRPLQIQAMDDSQLRVIGIPLRGDIERCYSLLAMRGVIIEHHK